LAEIGIAEIGIAEITSGPCLPNLFAPTTQEFSGASDDFSGRDVSRRS
jgi:hypothetical protein